MKATTIVILLLFVLVVWTIVYRRGENRDLKQRFVVAKATVTRVTTVHKGSTPRVSYIYSFKGRMYEGSQALSGLFFRNVYDTIEGLQFTVLIDSLDPCNNHLMVTPHDFEGMKWPYPDSLNWIRRVYHKGFWNQW